MHTQSPQLSEQHSVPCTHLISFLQRLSALQQTVYLVGGVQFPIVLMGWLSVRQYLGEILFKYYLLLTHVLPPSLGEFTGQLGVF